MKKDIHPKYYKDAKVTCSCGASFDLPGTQKEQQIEICSKCNPFYTGTTRFVDNAGRIEKFKARQGKTT
jgi:large subunit ribosomal protein L31